MKQRTQAEGKLIQVILQVGPTALIKEHGFFIPRPGFKFWLHHTEAIQANYLNSLSSSIKGLPSRFTEHTKWDKMHHNAYYIKRVPKMVAIVVFRCLKIFQLI